MRQLTLNLTGTAGLTLASGSPTQVIGDLPVGQEQQVSWSVQAAPQSNELTIGYAVAAIAMNTDTKIVGRSITLPIAGPPRWTTSYYVTNADPSVMLSLGRTLGELDRDRPGTQDNIVVLDFGEPNVQTDASGHISYGSFDFGKEVLSPERIEAAAEQFGMGYFLGTSGDFNSHLTLAIGTNNDNPGALDYTSHGQAWAQLVGHVQTWFLDRKYSQQVTAAGASDMELGWGTAASTKDWVNGYKSENQFLYDYGDAAGCTNDPCTTGIDGTAWSQDDVWYIAWGSGISFPLPEIYNEIGAQAAQWQQLAIYSSDIQPKHQKMFFSGSMTQFQACHEPGRDPAVDCAGVDNTPDQGWQQLWDTLNAADNPRINQRPRWSTDIVHQP